MRITSKLNPSFFQSTSQSEAILPRNKDDRDVELFRRFMETWSEIKFDSKNNVYVGRNKDSSLTINIDAVRGLDEDNLIEEIDFESLKNSQKDEWVQLPKKYKEYINKYEEEVLTFETEVKQRWASVRYDTKENCYFGSHTQGRRILDEEERILDGEEPNFKRDIKLSTILVRHISSTSKEHKKALEASKKEGNNWYIFPPGASSKGSKCGYRVISHQESSSFKYFHREKRIHVCFPH